MPTSLADIDRVQDMITDNAHRCLAAMRRAVWHPWSHQPRVMVQENIRVWFLEWERVLLQRYAELINDCPSIIGKQWHFEYTGLRCPRQWERVA